MEVSKIAVCVTTAMVTAGVAAAGEWGGYGSLGYAFEGQEGAELELGATYNFTDELALNISPLNVVIYEDEDDRYYEDEFSNGQSRCRDSVTGQFADDAECDPAMDWRGVLEGTYTFGGKLWLGGGAIVGEDTGPFGSAGYMFTDHIAASVRYGSDYGAAQVRLVF